MRKFIFQATLLILVIALGLFLFQQQPVLSELPFLPQKPIYGWLEVGDDEFRVEIANTRARRSKGLADRSQLASDEGMLFIFPEQDKYPFWMKGLNFPLDFVWIRGNRVVGIMANVQPPDPGQPDTSLPIFQSQEAIDKVLEINAGSVDRLDIKAGDEIRIKLN